MLTFFEPLEARRVLASFQVTNLNDAGVGSLRQAIADSNAQLTVDVIDFAPGLTGTITLGGAELAITDHLTIAGPGSGLLNISGNNASRVFSVTTGRSVTLSGLRVTGGSVPGGNGAGILNAGTLALNSVIVSGNAAGRGGGVYSTGAVTLTSTGVQDNTATLFGGGLHSAGSLSVIRSTVSGNTTPGAGGGIYTTGSATLTNSTVSGNSAGAGGGGIAGSGVSATLTFTNSTIASNTGGGISNGGAAALTSTIVAGNSVGDLTGNPVLAGSAYNLIQNAASAGGLIHNGDHNLVGSDPLLMPLDFYGGPTRTHALNTGSPAIANGNNPLGISTDQRGSIFARGAQTDIGSYQRQTLNIVVSAPAGADDDDYTDGRLTLIEAVGLANVNPGADAVTFASALTDGAIDITGSEIEILGDVTITGPGAGRLTIDGHGVARAFAIRTGTTVSISGLTITGGHTTTRGGGVLNEGTLTLDRVVVSANTASGGDGGAGIANLGTLAISNSTIAGNIATGGVSDGFGGGILNVTGTLTMTNCTVSGNASNTGGGIYNGAAATLIHSTISENTAALLTGGGIHNSNAGVLTITGATIALNTARVDAGDFGGGIDNQGTLSLRSSVVAGNTGGDLVGVAAGVGSTNNLVQNAISAGGLVNGANGNIVGADPLLGPLADNGGLTRTHALLAGSPAIGAGLNPLNFSTDQRGSGRVRGSAPDIGAFEFNLAPIIGSLTRDATSVQRAQGVTITASFVSDDGPIARVEFYHDRNVNGVVDAGELIGVDANADGGYSIEYIIPATTPLGYARLRAVAIDADGVASIPASAIVTIAGEPPSVSTLTTSVDSVRRGRNITLTANAATDNDGSIARVDFYLDANANGIAEQSEYLASDTNGGDGYVFTYNIPTRTPLGDASFLAVVIDNDGLASTPAAGAVTIEPVLLATPTGDAGALDAHEVVWVDRDGNIFVYVQGWTRVSLQQKTGAPAAIADAVIWIDPKDGLSYVAAPTDEGLLLFVRSGKGEWSFRNLTTETGASATPVRYLTRFISVREQVVVVAGITAEGRLAAFRQTLAAGAPFGRPTFAFVDISGDLNAQGFSTPDLTGLTSYVPAWDTWHLAGVDAAGRIQSIWINTNNPEFTKWRLDDLSAITGAPPVVGQLAITLTSWGGINLTGLDGSGSLLTTWWVPSFGGDWEVSNLTALQDGPRLVGGNLTAYTTPWGGINYVGVDGGGVTRVYWWVPDFGGDWAVDPLLPANTPTSKVPMGALTSSSSASGTLNVYGLNGAGNVLRAWWQPAGSSAWTIDDLSEVSTPI